MSKQRMGSEYIPLVGEDMTKVRLVLPFSKVALCTVSLPFTAFLFCIVWSIIYNFEHSNSTHCKVYNFLPSVSAAIGHYKPQKDVWKFAIAVQAIMRSSILLFNFRYYREHVYQWAQFISRIVLLTYALENISLVTLSFWTSNESYAFHKLSFITFLLTSFIHMFILYYLLSNCRNSTKDISEIKSLKWKWRLMMCNVGAILAAVYFFYRHNKYCEPFDL
ncbi:post-GPI attachment to proteins factor 2-like isoform X2 [Prorops nasuta]|uniref:post-GPI attachment to proteins factor 2-like isoform X2 n=1 Tax=Prorops nasuta TaxID=863751 RepID=UPI0034CE932D